MIAFCNIVTNHRIKRKTLESSETKTNRKKYILLFSPFFENAFFTFFENAQGKTRFLIEIQTIKVQHILPNTQCPYLGMRSSKTAKILV